jgi:hypothetical protein
MWRAPGLVVVSWWALGCGPYVSESDASSPEAEASVAPPMAKATNPGLLQFSVEGLAVPHARWPVLRVALRNLTWDQTLWVKYVLSTSFGRHFQSDVWIEAEGNPPHDNVACSHCGRRSPEPPLEYVRLLPQAEISVVTSIYCSPLPPGQYRITAHYQDDGRDLVPPPAGSIWFAGELISETVDLDVPER